MNDRETESRKPDDPSLEEILASIRQIVFENDDKEAGSRARGGNAGPDASETTPEAATPDEPAPEPPREDRADPAVTAEELPEERIAVETDSAETTGLPQEAVSPEPQEPVADIANPADRPSPAGRGEDDDAAGPGDSVLLLTEMIAPDGSVVHIDARRAQARPDAPMADGADTGSGESPEERPLDAGAEGEFAAAFREWLDRNGPDIVDRVARRELRKLADRQE